MNDNKTIHALVAKRSPLLALEKKISSFNFFEATGATRRELRHSDFIAFLFDANASHGLEDAFYKLFCDHVGITREKTPHLTVLREWRNIDILIHDRANNLVFVIENKVDTTEHSGQLERYRTIIETKYPDCSRHYFYLTKTGETPSDDQYDILSYTDIRLLIQSLRTRNDLLSDVHLALTHYEKLIEQHFMPDNDIADLCRTIYAEHKRAIDLIIEHMPSGTEDLFAKMRALIEADGQFEIDGEPTAQRLRFAPKAWDQIPELFTAKKWTSTGRFLLFEIVHNTRSGQVDLQLYFGPTDSKVKPALFAKMQEPESGFTRTRSLGTRWSKLYNTALLGEDELGQEDTLDTAEKNWRHFLAHDFPKMNQVVENFIATQQT